MNIIYNEGIGQLAPRKNADVTEYLEIRFDYINGSMTYGCYVERLELGKAVNTNDR